MTFTMFALPETAGVLSGVTETGVEMDLSILRFFDTSGATPSGALLLTPPFTTVWAGLDGKGFNVLDLFLFSLFRLLSRSRAS